MNTIVITKRIAKQGRNNVIIIPYCLRDMLHSGMIVKIEMTPMQGVKK